MPETAAGSATHALLATPRPRLAAQFANVSLEQHRRLTGLAGVFAEALVEAMARLPGERERGQDPLRPGGPVPPASRALLELSRAIECCDDRYGADGLVHAAVAESHGPGLAALTVRALRKWRRRQLDAEAASLARTDAG
jgi:hypothetical protein